MTPVQSPEFEGVPYVQWPTNFFERKDLKGLFKKWGSDASHWLMAIMTAVRESKSRDRFEISGQAMTRDDLDLIHCWPAIDPDWVTDAIKYGLLAEDTDGCLLIVCRKQFVIYPDETRYAVAKAKQRSSKETNERHSEDTGETSKRQRDDKSHNTSQVKSSQSNTNQNKSIQSNAAEQGRVSDGRTSSDGSERVHPGGTPPEPPSFCGSTFSPNHPPTMDQAAEAFSKALQAVEPGKPRAQEVEWWLDLQAESAAQPDTPEPDPLDLYDAIAYAKAATQWQKSFGPEPIKQPRSYLYTTAKRAMFQAFDRNRDRRASYRDGFKDPGPVQWRPPDANRGDP